MKNGKIKRYLKTVFSLDFVVLCAAVIIFIYLSIGALTHRIHVSGLEHFPHSMLDWFAIIAVAGFLFLIVVANIGIYRLLKNAVIDEQESDLMR